MVLACARVQRTMGSGSWESRENDSARASFRLQPKGDQPIAGSFSKGHTPLGVDFPFCSTIVLFKNRIRFPKVSGGLERFGSLERMGKLEGAHWNTMCLSRMATGINALPRLGAALAEQRRAVAVAKGSHLEMRLRGGGSTASPVQARFL